GEFLAHLVNSLPEPLPVRGFKQIINRVHFEGVDCVLVERCHEDNQWQSIKFEHLQYCKTVQVWHLHIQQDEIGLFSLDLLDCCQAAVCLADDLDIIERREHSPQPLSRQFFIVNNNCADHLPGCFSSRAAARSRHASQIITGKIGTFARAVN